jgi:hypothetical protein
VFEVTGDWTKLCDEERHHVYCSPDAMWGDEVKGGIDRACDTYGGEDKCMQRFDGET